MKTTITILAAVLVLLTSALFAGNETSSIPVPNDNTTIAMEFLAPVAPAEATFEDFTGDMLSIFDLAPVVPAQADFEDIVAEVIIDNGVLAPVTPSVDFE